MRNLQGALDSDEDEEPVETKVPPSASSTAATTTTTGSDATKKKKTKKKKKRKKNGGDARVQDIEMGVVGVSTTAVALAGAGGEGVSCGR